jgi:hypothetical protein
MTERYKRKFTEDDSSVSIGEEIYFGKFKNKSATITGFGVDEHNQPTIKTDKGEMPLYHFRIKRLMRQK